MALSFEEIRNKVAGNRSGQSSWTGGQQENAGAETFDQIRRRISGQRRSSSMTVKDAENWFKNADEALTGADSYLQTSSKYDGWQQAASPAKKLKDLQMQEASVRAWLNRNKEAYGDRYDTVSDMLDQYSQALGRSVSGIRDVNSYWENLSKNENKQPVQTQAQAELEKLEKQAQAQRDRNRLGVGKGMEFAVPTDQELVEARLKVQEQSVPRLSLEEIQDRISQLDDEIEDKKKGRTILDNLGDRFSEFASDYSGKDTQQTQRQVIEKLENQRTAYKQQLYYAENDAKLAELPEELRQKVQDYLPRHAAASFLSGIGGQFPSDIPGNTKFLLKDGKRYTADEITKLAGEYETGEYGDLVDELDAAGVDGHKIIEYMRLRQGQEYARLENEDFRKAADEHPILMSAASVLAAPFKLGGIFDSGTTALSNAITGEERPLDLSKDAYLASRMQSNVRGQVAENINNDFGSFVYQTGMSMGDFLLTSPLAAAPGGQAAVSMIMGGGAATDAAIDIAGRGGTASQSFLGGILAGAAEAAFEKFSLDAFVKPKSVGSIGTYIANILKGAGVEGSEELGTEIANAITDQIVMGDKSNFSLNIQAHMADGMSRAEAENAAMADLAKQVGLAFAGGALSGGAVHGVQSGVNYADNYRAGQNIIQSGETDAVLQQAANAVDADTQLARNAAHLQARQDAGEPLSPALLGSTAQMTAQAKGSPAYRVRETGLAAQVDEDTIATVAQVANQTGRHIEFVPTLGAGIDGRYDADTGTLYIAADSQSPIRAVLKHELTHSLEGSKAYQELSDFMLSDVIRTAAESQGMTVDDFVQAKMQQYADAGVTLAPEGAVKELVADYAASRLFTDEAAIRRLSAQRPSAARRFLNWIRSLKTKLTGTAQEKMLARAEQLYHQALMEPRQSPSDGAQYSLFGINKNGIEVYETSPEIKSLSYRDRMKQFLDIMERQYKGRTAKFIRNGHPYYARFEKTDVRKNIYGDKRSDSKGQRAKINVGADGNIFELVENAQYNGSRPELGKTTSAHQGVSHWDYFVKTVQIDGAVYDVVANVRQKADGSYVYSIQLNENKKVEAAPPLSNNVAFNRAFTTSTDTTVPQSAAGVNPSISENVPDDTQYALGYLGGDIDAEMARLVEKYGAIKKGEAPARDVQIPQQTNDDTRTRRFVRTALESSQVPDEFVGGITQDVMKDVYSYVPISNQEAMNSAVQLVETLGMDKALAQWNAVAGGDKPVSKYDIALGEYLLVLAGKNNNPALASKLIIDLATLGTEAGQVAQAMSMLKRMTPEGRLIALQRIADKVNKEQAKKPRKGQKKVEIPETVVEKMQQADPQDQAAVDQIFQEGLVSIAEQTPADWLDKWNAWRYLAMLGNPRTHVRNIVGNAAFMPVVYAKNFLAGAIEGAVGSMSRAAGGKGIVRTKTALAALPFTKRQVYEAFADQNYLQNKERLNSGNRLNPADIVRDNRPVFTSKLGKPLEAARKANSRAMEAEDGWFKRLYYKRALMQYMAANKLDPETMDLETLHRAENYAMREAQKATYADDSAFANMLSRASKSNKAAGVIIEGVLPFKKTPINIAKRAVEYSPAGLAYTLTRKAYQLKNGKITAAEFIDSLAAGMTGSMVVALGMWLFSKGLLTSGLGDDKEDDFARLQGAQEYALNIDGTSYTLDFAAPIALPLFVGAEIQKLNQESKDGEVPFPKMLEAMTNIAEPMINMSMLQGVNDSIENVKFSDNGVVDLALNTAAGYISQAVPTLFGQIARTSDDTRRRNYVEPGSAFPSLQMAFQRNKSKIPGALQTQQLYIDAWGREEPTGNIGERAFENFVSPGYIGREQTSPMEKELLRLYNQVGEDTSAKILPSAAAKTITSGGETYALTAPEYTAYQRAIGRTAYDMLTELTSSSAYQSLSDEHRAEAVSKIYAYAGDIGKETALSARGVKYTPLSSTEKIDAVKRQGISVPTYLLFITKAGDLKADKKANGDPINGSKKRKVEALLDDMGVSGKQRQVLLALAGYGSEQQRERILGEKTDQSAVGESIIDRLLKEALS